MVALQVNVVLIFDVPMEPAEIDDPERQRAIAEGVLRETLERVDDLPHISSDVELRHCWIAESAA